MVWFVIGTLIAGAYFWWVLGFDAQLRLRADVYGYINLAIESPSVLDVLGVYEHRSPGFPLILKLLEVGITPLLPAGGAKPWFEYAPYFFFAFHVTVMVVLFAAAGRLLTRRYGLPALHPLWLLLLLIHPGLIANTSLLLSDIWSIDLMFLGIALMMRMDGGPWVRGSLAAIAGICWSWAVLARPSLMVGALAAVAGLVLAGWLERGRSFADGGSRGGRLGAREYALVGAFSVTTILTSLPCSLHYGTFCNVRPSFSSDVVAGSLVTGLTNVRLYWSSLSDKPTRMEVIDDPWLVAHLRDACGIEVAKADGMAAIGCLAARPWIWPVYLGKKVMALIDQQHFQPYTPHATSPVARRTFRVFSALTWAGLCLWVGWLVMRFRRHPQLAALSLFPLMILATHSLMHVESRYSLSVVPGAYIALGVLHRWLGQRPSPGRGRPLAAVVLLVSAIGLFLWQVGAWDRLDQTQAYTDMVYDRNIRL